MHQCCTGYFFYCRSWYGRWFSCTGNSYFSVCQCHSLYVPPDACGRRISVRVKNDPFWQAYAKTDYSEWRAVRVPELSDCYCKCFCTVKYQCIWENGNGRLWFLFKSRGICFFTSDMFYNGPDNFCQPESWCQTVWTGEKRCKIWNHLFGDHCRADRHYHICGGTGTDCCF